MDKEKKDEKDTPASLLQIDPKWYVRRPTFLYRMVLNERSFQDALRKFFQPIKNDDARLDFYTMYKREATEYDTDYVKKYDEDLNTTLIFVRRVSFIAPSTYLTRSCRRVCFPPSVPLSSSMSTRASNPIRTIKPQLSSAPSSSPSTNPPSRTKPPPFLPPRKTLPAKLS